MTSLILRTTMRILLPLLLLYSLFLFFRGHNDIGGGFVGGLVASGAFALYAIAYDVAALRRLLRVDPRNIIPWGLLVAALAGLFPVFQGRPFLTGEWSEIKLPAYIPFDLGTPMLFELGVYLVVLGSTLTILLSLMEE